MKIRYTPAPEAVAHMTTEELREKFLIESLFEPGALCLVYCDVDRAIAGSAVPVDGPMNLDAAAELQAEYFCQRRELGVLNIGAGGTITVDGTTFPMVHLDGLYVGRGAREVVFASDDSAVPARFFLVSFPAHATHPTAHIRKDDAAPVALGADGGANTRTIYKYIHPGGVKSCQLVMGFTQLAEGSVWNTMPPHTHPRRMEVYLYFGLPEGERVFHFMGLPSETRHLVVADGQAVLSPSWSLHAGAGTRAYAFCWGMGGENQDFGDMDAIATEALR